MNKCIINKNRIAPTICYIVKHVILILHFDNEHCWEYAASSTTDVSQLQKCVLPTVKLAKFMWRRKELLLVAY